MKKVLIYGLKNSGKSSILALKGKYELFIYDDNKEVLENVYNEFSQNVIKLEEINQDTIKDFFMVVLSPSISVYKKEIELLKRENERLEKKYQEMKVKMA